MSTPTSGRTVLAFVLISIALILAVGYGKHRYTVAKAKAETADQAARVAAEYARAHPPAPPEFPLSGEGHATKQVGLKVWLDPMKTYVRASKPAKYVFVEDTDVFFDDTEGVLVETPERRKEWLNLPPGKYLVYPLKGDKLYFRWWQ